MMKRPDGKYMVVKCTRGCGKTRHVLETVMNGNVEILEKLLKKQKEAEETINFAHEQVLKLTIERNELQAKLAQVERERVAAVADLKDSGDCRYCKNLDLSDNCGFGNCCTCENDKCPCCKCDRKNDHFEWRGVCAENAKEE